ncbi:MAG TPA: GNAT family N-acetyltransferase [Bacteroidia bacterium]|nr:GNAT family N-acetyltransferase [Bacteroidia bacterium]
MNFIIRKGKKEDLSEVLNLIKELALFEKAPEEVTNTLSKMEEDGFGPKPVFSFFVATLEDKIIGVALYFTKYSTWKGKGLYLDDLVITESMRGKGLGSKLFKAFIEEAKAMKAQQVHWQVLNWNTPAINFYKKLNASIEDDWLNCKLSFDQIKEFDTKPADL